MDVEIGIQNVARPVRFTTKDSAESVAATLKEATDAGSIAQFTDEKGETVLVNGKAIGYAIVGEEEPRHVGFGM
ncbi:DUF3107 domain-containing protein [Pseudoscardovia suis]|jgi:propanediol dehydratase small subunit|uniref:ATP-binding protein n=1 Tax=Pseudoscardovia suis TaxID=987063 RepID=A0A261F188_9BIFI|nr:DUF3107 domain-containing protein [Pseudoscardovia suis]OZG52889.1 ATP-binding protein [Pseudoscardovia suis]PJJ68394.1 uncharacterized protein DUF3107 [Pseudoscardovia suis]